MLECERGLRASHAYPVSLFVPADSGARKPIRWNAMVLALSRYGVPVEPLEAPTAAALEHLAERETTP